MTATVIAVAMLKGGVGKTTTTVALATAAARDGLRVAVVDADPQFSAVAWAAEAGGLGFPVVRARKSDITLRIKATVDEHDVVFIDGPPGESDMALTKAATTRADLAIVPLSPSGLDLDRALRTLELLDEWRVPTAMLIVRTDQRTRVHQQLVTALAGDQNVSVLDTHIPRTVRLAEAFGEALPEGDLYGYVAAWHEIRQALRLATPEG